MGFCIWESYGVWEKDIRQYKGVLEENTAALEENGETGEGSGAGALSAFHVFSGERDGLCGEKDCSEQREGFGTDGELGAGVRSGRDEAYREYVCGGAGKV